MKYLEYYLPEFDHEMQTTRAVLARVPEGRADWRPHAKSTPLGELAQHVANIAGYGEMVLTSGAQDFHPAGSAPVPVPVFRSTDALLASFDRNVAATRAALQRTTEADLTVPWSLKLQGVALFTLPRAAVLRSFVLSHLIHHRGQLSVYLRLLDVPVPSIYGPTADEAPRRA